MLALHRKHFTWEDYDQWLFGESGVWSIQPETRRPDVLVLQMGLHTCIHAHSQATDVDTTLIQKHESQVKVLLAAVQGAVNRTRSDGKPKTTVIVSTSGRQLSGDPRSDRCVWRFNRIVAHEAHKQSFIVFEREEIEHRLLFKSEFSITENVVVKPDMHLEVPAPQILATSLLHMISCLELNGTAKHSPGVGKVSQVIVAKDGK